MLQDASRYSFTAHVTVQSTDELMRYTFRFLNTSHTSILFTIEDVSNVVDHDSLTDAYSRSGFLKRAQAVLESSENRSEFAVAFFNVRGFKAVNAVFGRTAGDEVLQQIADRLKSSTLHPLVIGRFESDHFVCLVRRDDLDGSEVRRLCRDIYTTGTKEYRYFLHCGICMIDSDEYDVELICDYAKLSKIPSKTTSSNPMPSSTRRCSTGSSQPASLRATCRIRWTAADSRCITSPFTRLQPDISSRRKRSCAGSTLNTALYLPASSYLSSKKTVSYRSLTCSWSSLLRACF